MKVRYFVALAATLSLSGLVQPVSAESAAPKIAVAHAGGGQPALAVGFDPDGQLLAAVCAVEGNYPCTTAGATKVEVPPEAAKHAASGVLRVVRLGLERKAVVVQIPDPGGAATWSAIILAPLHGASPIVPFSDYTGFVAGVDGERSGPSVLVRDEGVYVGVVQEGRDLCGRPALLLPKALDPNTLTLLPAKVQRLTDDEIAHAIPAAAAKTDSIAKNSLLHAAWATSAADGTSAFAITDGKLDTAWAEGRGGVGRGEAVVLNAPREVPLAALELTLPPAPEPGPASGAHGPRADRSKVGPVVPPKELFVATDHELFRVTLPNDAAKTPGARLEVPLATPIRTSCVAVVVESGFQDVASDRVGLAEIAARPALTGSVEELVRALGNEGADGDAAAAVLAASGHEAFVAVAAAFGSLPPLGVRRALDVLDEAPCADAVQPYLVALAGAEAERSHARASLGRCGKEEAATIAETLRTRDPAARLVLADELVTAAPGAAVDAIVPLIGSAPKRERRAYRAALARAITTPDGAAAFLRMLDRTDLPLVASVDLLRAAGELLPRFGEVAAHAFSRLTSDAPSFRTRFLLLAPAATLAEQDAVSRSFLRHAMSSDPSALIRAEAARVLVDPRPFDAELSRALDDPDVRVREASASSLGAGSIQSASERLLYRFQQDPWPMVRVSSAHALARLGPSVAADAALTHAIDYDESPDVRREALLAVGARGVIAAAPLARSRLVDRIETDPVRSAAALSLGLLCDRDSADVLTEQALKLASPVADESERRVAESSLVALGWMKPPDLDKRLARLTNQKMPGPIRRLAGAAIASKSHCEGPRALGHAR